MSPDTWLAFAGLCIVAWQLDRLHRLLKAIHYMMHHEFEKKNDLGRDE